MVLLLYNTLKQYHVEWYVQKVTVYSHEPIHVLEVAIVVTRGTKFYLRPPVFLMY